MYFLWRWGRNAWFDLVRRCARLASHTPNKFYQFKMATNCLLVGFDWKNRKQVSPPKYLNCKQWARWECFDLWPSMWIKVILVLCSLSHVRRIWTLEIGYMGVDQEIQLWTHQPATKFPQSICWLVKTSIQPCALDSPVPPPSPPSCWCMLLTVRSRADEGLVRFMFSCGERGTAQTHVCEVGLRDASSTLPVTYPKSCLGFFVEDTKKNVITDSGTEFLQPTEFLDFFFFFY